VQQITSKDELLSLLKQRVARPRATERFSTGVGALDDLAPDGTFQCGAIHELLAAAVDPLPVSFALILARAAQQHHKRASDALVAWSDPAHEIYAPALAAGGLPLRGLVLLRPRKALDELRIVMECLRCPGVAVTVATVGRLTRVEARRLQLAAERGGGVGLLLRRFDARSSAIYAAATRWLVTPAPGNEQCQRWSVELMHGHGGRVGESVLLEVDRESSQVHAVRPFATLADRPLKATPRRATA